MPNSDRFISHELLETAAPHFEGRISYAAENFDNGRAISFGGGNKHATASIIKLPILVHALLCVEEGTLSLDRPIKLVESEKTPGSGILTHLTDGLTIPVRDVLMLMNILSDNTATNMMIDLLGVDPINQRMRQLGLRVTTLFRKVYSSDLSIPEENLKFGLGVTTPDEMLSLLKLIATDQLGLETEQLLLRDILSKQFYKDGIPRMLPTEFKYEGKTGAVDAVRNDVGIVTTPNGVQIAIAIFVDKLPVPNWTADNPGLIAIAKLAKLIVEYLD